jgi:periplasmic divalent cation tolerance protein
VADSDSLIIVTTTVADRPTADKIARSLVESCHAACVQIVPEISSTYYWQGEVCVDSEYLLLIKTLAAKYTLRWKRSCDRCIPTTNQKLWRSLLAP